MLQNKRGPLVTLLWSPRPTRPPNTVCTPGRDPPLQIPDFEQTKKVLGPKSGVSLPERRSGIGAKSPPAASRPKAARGKKYDSSRTTLHPPGAMHRSIFACALLAMVATPATGFMTGSARLAAPMSLRPATACAQRVRPARPADLKRNPSTPGGMRESGRMGSEAQGWCTA